MTTESPPAPVVETPAAPPSAVQAETRQTVAPDPALGGLSPAEVRRNSFIKAFAKEDTVPEVAQEAAPAAAEKLAAATKVDRAAKKADTEAQAPTPAVEAAAPAPASKDAPAEKATPQAEASPPLGDTPPPAEAPAAEPTPKRGIPPEFLTPEHEAVYKADPLAKREVARLYGDPNLSDVEKAVKASSKIDAAKGRIAERQTKQAERLALREQGNFEELGRLHAAELDERSLSTEAEAVVTRLLATVAGTTMDDAGFLTAGDDAATDEDRYTAWGKWLAKESPIGKEVLAEVEASLSQRHEATVAELKAQFAEEKKALEATFKDTLATEVEKARSQARAGNPPPRGNAIMPTPGEFVRPGPPTILNAREAMRAGIAARDEARAN